MKTKQKTNELGRRMKFVPAIMLILGMIFMASAIFPTAMAQEAAVAEETIWYMEPIFMIGMLIAGVGGVILLMADAAGLRQGGKKFAVLMIAGGLLVGGISVISTGLTVEPPIIPGPDADVTWDNSLTESAAYIVWTDTHTAIWYVDFNTTGDGSFQNSTGAATFALRVAREGGSEKDVRGTAEVTNIGTKTIGSIMYSVIDIGVDDDLPEADWTTSGGLGPFQVSIDLPASEDTIVDNATCAITLNSDLFDELTAGQGASFQFAFEGEIWTINTQVRESDAL